jgi:iron(III) transport system ATP-binding protein
VVRNVFLGNTRDYIVEVADGTQLRITAAPGLNLAPGAAVWLLLPPERCRALVG